MPFRKLSFKVVLISYPCLLILDCIQLFKFKDLIMSLSFLISNLKITFDIFCSKLWTTSTIDLVNFLTVLVC